MMLMSLFLYGCAQDELITEQEETEEVYTVSLKLNGDIQVENSPLSRAETDSRDLYGIQVYRNGNYFAAGMFTKTDNITIDLVAGSTYKFVCTVVKEGQDKCYYSSSYGFGYSSGSAFRCSYGNTLWSWRNNFYYSNSSSYSLLNLSESYISYGNSSTSVLNAEIDRFYGELDNYTPSVNGVVSLDLKRVSFGLKLQVTNIKEGKVHVKCKNNNKTFISTSNLTDDYETEMAVYSMSNIYDAWRYADTGYTEAFTLTVTWDREGGLISDTWTKKFQVKRNALNTVRIKMGTDDKGDVGVGVDPEGGDMGNEGEEIPLG
jgi:hypothetical protein